MSLIPGIILMAALLGCTSDGPAAMREWLRMVRTSAQFGQQVMTRLRATVQHRSASPCPCVAERKARARMEACAFDPFKNSTEHEEYRSS
jgi:hypothetical protein